MKIKRMSKKKETRTRPDLAGRAIGAQERMQIKQLRLRSEPLEKKPIKKNEISSNALPTSTLSPRTKTNTLINFLREYGKTVRFSSTI